MENNELNIEIKKVFDLKGTDVLTFLGIGDENLRVIQDNFDSKVIVRGQEVIIMGSEAEVSNLENLLADLVFYINKHNKLDKQNVLTAIHLAKAGDIDAHTKSDLDSVVLFTDKDFIKPRTEGQKSYIESVQKNEIVFAVGPAGTGKTYLAVAMALQFLKSRQVSRIVLARPAVEAGESLGFLPGDMRDKIDPYLWPLYDSLNDMLPAAKLKKYLENNTIQIVPLAYMRGRTLNNAFAILDEAQNSSMMQMKMFLTRLGANSRAIITGDVTQVDLKDTTKSGLKHIRKVLVDVDGIEFIDLKPEDVVRHKLVKDIIEAYDKFNNGDSNGNGEKE